MSMIVFLFAAAAAQNFPVRPANSRPARPADAEKVICRSERLVGSNNRQRICKTKEKWDEDRHNAKEGLELIKGFTPGGGNAPPPTG